jgi:kumamolisin
MACSSYAKPSAEMFLALTAFTILGGAIAEAADVGLAPLPVQAAGISVNDTLAVQTVGSPHIIVPPSDKTVPGYAHTNVKLLALPGGAGIPPVPGVSPVPPQAANLVETPASVGCVYHMTNSFSTGCSPITAKAPPVGGGHGIAVVTAYHNPNALSDLLTFSNYFNLFPQPSFTYVYAGVPGCNNGPVPPSGVGTGWDLEAAMAIEAAHAMSPSARIFLVEAQSPSISDMVNAIDTATACVQGYYGGQIVMPWSIPEFPTEASLDSHFNNSGVIYLAAAGDAPGVNYPAASPFVFGVGGTTFSRNQGNGNFKGEAVWNDAYYGIGTGGGPSLYESIPSYQNFSPLNQLLNNRRGTPDLAGLADPVNGFWIYNTTYQNGWAPLGGTGLATALTAGGISWQGLSWSSSLAALTNVYWLGQIGHISGYLTNVNNGLCGPGGALGGLGQGYNPQWIESKYIGVIGGIQPLPLTWDWCTGWGSYKGPR